MSGRILGYRETQILRLVAEDIAAFGRVRCYDAIAQLLGMRRSHVCDVVGRLERRGLLQRVGPIGRRMIIIPQSGEAA